MTDERDPVTAYKQATAALYHANERNKSDLARLKSQINAALGAIGIYEQSQNDPMGVSAEGTLAVVTAFLTGELPLGEQDVA